MRLRVDLSAVERVELVRGREAGQVGLVERSPVVEELEGRFEGVRPGRRRGRTLTLVSVGQHGVMFTAVSFYDD